MPTHTAQIQRDLLLPLSLHHTHLSVIPTSTGSSDCGEQGAPEVDCGGVEQVVEASELQAGPCWTFSAGSSVHHRLQSAKYLILNDTGASWPLTGLMFAV